MPRTRNKTEPYGEISKFLDDFPEMEESDAVLCGLSRQTAKLQNDIRSSIKKKKRNLDEWLGSAPSGGARVFKVEYTETTDNNISCNAITEATLVQRGDRSVQKIDHKVVDSGKFEKKVSGIY